LEVRRLILGLLRTEPFTAGLLRTVMRVARAGLCAMSIEQAAHFATHKAREDHAETLLIVK
jgi:hypothetical protein